MVSRPAKRGGKPEHLQQWLKNAEQDARKRPVPYLNIF
jgi:hypothetical protein